MGQQRLPILEQLVDGLGILGAVGRLELVDRQVRGLLVLGVHDRVQHCLDLRLQTARHRVQHICDLVHPAALFTAVGEDLTHGASEAKCTITDGQDWRAHAAALEITQHLRPRFDRLTLAVADSHQLRASVSAHADHHQAAQTLLLQANVEVDPIGP